jgi:hypothetical protein
MQAYSKAVFCIAALLRVVGAMALLCTAAWICRCHNSRVCSPSGAAPLSSTSPRQQHPVMHAGRTGAGTAFVAADSDSINTSRADHAVATTAAAVAGGTGQGFASHCSTAHLLRSSQVHLIDRMVLLSHDHKSEHTTRHDNRHGVSCAAVQQEGRCRVPKHVEYQQ